MNGTIEFDNREIKRNAKMVLQISKPSPLLVGLLFLAVLFLLTFLDFKLQGYGDLAVWEKMNSYIEKGDSDGALRYFYSIEPTAFEQIVSYALGLAETILNAGFVIFILNSVRANAPTVFNLLDGFTQFFRVIILSILQGLIVGLGTLLLIVPGIIAAYTYRFALHILLDHPEMGIFQCMAASRTMMRGYKGQLFMLDLSMIGWILLFLVFPPVGIYVIPYLYTCWALFYEKLQGKEFSEESLRNPKDPNSLPPSDDDTF